MKLKDVLDGFFPVSEEGEREVTGIAYDSRKVKSGNVFVAMRGGNADGHDFITNAIKNGAVTVVYEKDKRQTEKYVKAYPDISWVAVSDPRLAIAALSRNYYRNPSADAAVIGITGTNGKTTTSYLVKSILEHWSQTVGLIGTIAYLIGDTSYQAPHTTPESPDFQGLLREMADRGCRYVVAEVSSHALVQKRVDYTRFQVAVFTNLTRDHLDFHETMENYFSAKQRLFTELLSEDGVAVINSDDSYSERLLKSIKDKRGDTAKVITYSIQNKGADLVVSDVRTTFRGTTFRLKGAVNNGRIDDEISTGLVGTTNVYNVLAAVSVALSLNIPMHVIKEGIVKARTIKGRFENVDLGQSFLAVVDYAHTEDALERLLLTVRELLAAQTSLGGRGTGAVAAWKQIQGFQKNGRARVITVFGCGGDRDSGKRPKMGRIATQLSDIVIITSDNPRNEDPKHIIRDIERGIEGDTYIVIPDRKTAITMAVALASAGDIVVVAGKGHEEYQEVKGKRYDFSDRYVIEGAIRRMLNTGVPGPMSMPQARSRSGEKYCPPPRN